MKELTINEMELVSGAMAVIPRVGQAIVSASKNPIAQNAATGAGVHGIKTGMAGEDHVAADYAAAAVGGAAGGAITRGLGGSSNAATNVGAAAGGAAEGFMTRIMDALGLDSSKDGNDYCEDGSNY